ncbi:MAG: di-heme oxidoredictase family protein [Actinomycetota bacterium]
MAFGSRARLVLGIVALVVLASCGGGGGDDVPVLLGGETTRDVANTGSRAFGFPASTLTNDERRVFEIGDSFFTQNWVSAPASTDARDGLGPMFNAQACSSCHLRDGRGTPASTGEGELGLLLRLSIPGTDENGGPNPHPVYGGQLQDRAILGVPVEGELVVTYEDVVGEYGDGTEYVLRRPIYTVEGAFGPLGDDIMISPRLAPQVIGMGLLEAIPEADIRAAADPDDEDGDGISGRPNEVWNVETGSTALGRFGWKANTPNVRVQSADAFNGDMGITSSLFPIESCTEAQSDCAAAPNGNGPDGEPEVTDSRLGSVTFYTRTLAVPAARGADDPDVRRGAQLFEEFNCSACHTPTHRTGPVEVVGVPALSDQVIHPYTDLLLHDMGEGLADGRPDFLASGTEWRTPPLWGIGLLDYVNGELFLLHDGRARTIV